MQNKPWLIVVSGPNGAGKTTFVNHILEQNPFFKDAVIANWDDDFAKMSSVPENREKTNALCADLENKAAEIKTKLVARFKSAMEKIGGDLQTRIDNRSDFTNDYWREQFSASMHIQPEHEYLLDTVTTYNDLMRTVGGGDVHARINAKEKTNNWYKLYKKLVYTIEIQNAIHLTPLKQKIDSWEQEMYINAGIKTLKKIDNALSAGKNMIYETTGAGQKAKSLIKKAKNKYNYSVYSFHPYVLRPELSVARVKHRVETGGHNVPTDVIFSRYDGSLQNLATILSLVDIGIVMDNSGKKPYMPVFAQANGHIVDFAECPQYLQETRQVLVDTMPLQSVQDLLHLQQNIDIKKLSEEQRENFGQIAISAMLGHIR